MRYLLSVRNAHKRDTSVTQWSLDCLVSRVQMTVTDKISMALGQRPVYWIWDNDYDKTTLFTPVQGTPLFEHQKTVDKRDFPCRTASSGGCWLAGLQNSLPRAVPAVSECVPSDTCTSQVKFQNQVIHFLQREEKTRRQTWAATGSHSFQKSFWNRPWTFRQTDYEMNKVYPCA